jgi:pimeloyl-ACP methyl ester carboxylesterase
MLIGHSLGGAAVLSASVEIPEVVAVATIGALADPHHVEHHFASAKDEIEKKGVAEVSIGGRPFRIKKGFLDDIADQKLTEKIKNMKKALLIFHSYIDNIVGIENALEIY